MADKDLFAPPSKEERSAAETAMFAAPSADERAKLEAYMSKAQPSELASALAGAEQGLTLNHAPQLGAALGAGLEKGAGMMGMGPQATGPKQSLSDLYNEYLAANKKRDALAQATNPMSYAGGAIGGGLLGYGAGSMAAKPAMAALAARAPGVAATGQVLNKIAPGAIPMAIGGALGAQGASEAPLASTQMAEDMAQGAGAGIAGSAVAPPALSKAANAAQKTASAVKGATKIAGETVFGLTPDAFKRGLAGEMLVGKEAAKKTGDEMLQFAQQLPGQLESELNKLGAQKQSIIRIAQENGVRIPPEEIDNFMQSHLSNTSPSSLAEAQREMAQFHEILKTAKSGPEVKQVIRRYFGLGNTEKGEFANLFQQKQMEQDALAPTEPPPPTSQKEQFEQEFAQRQAEQRAVPGSNPNPLELTYEPIDGSDNVLGIIRQKSNGTEPTKTFRKVASRLIDPNDPEDVQAAEDMLSQKRAEQAAIPGSDPNELELHHEPTDIPITDDQGNVTGQKHLAVVRQPQEDVGNQDYYTTVSKKVIEPDATPTQRPKIEMLLQPTDVLGKSLGIIRQPILDEQGNITGYKRIASKLLSDDEAALWKDVNETVRAGGKDLTEPEQLYQLYKDLKEKSQYGDTSFKTADAKKATAEAIEDIQTLLRKQMDELEPTDERIHALKNAQEILGATDKDPRNVMKTFAALLGKQENPNVPGAAARQDLTNLINQIKIANPTLGHQIEAQAQNLANKFSVTGAIQKEIYLPRPTATLKAYAAKGANVLGYGIGQVTPDWMLSVAQELGQRGGQAQKALSAVLSKAASKDDQTRTAIMFGLMQQPGYREVLKEFMPQAHPVAGGTKPSTRDLDKYK